MKFEIDTDPPEGAAFERKYRLLPSPYEINLYDGPSLFAGKIHAVICRGWKDRIKGRDLYDYLFYLARKIEINIPHLKAKLIDSNYIRETDDLTIESLVSLLEQKFKSIDYNQAKKDVSPFLKDTTSLELWDADFFISVTRQYLLNNMF